ncbi:hypothetical protein [Kribbella sp. NPDC048928]|uniref:hypothetical protein n=1 Tax=Kribbella sp. NPDC048928 TaxID=3364111 RepID=UPI0037243700
MPSELQRVARGLVDCFDEIPRVVDQLMRTAARCRENAQVALIASRGQATVAAQQLDAAAQACEAAAHFLSMAPPKARGWAEGLLGDGGPSTNRPSSDSADRTKLAGVEIRTSRLTATYEDLEVAEDNEPPLVAVARKAFEKYRKTREKDDEDQDPQEPLEVEITLTETGEIILQERDQKEEQKRADRLSRDFGLTPDRAEDEDEDRPGVEERDEKEERKRVERLTRDFGLTPDRAEDEERDEKEEQKRVERLTRDFGLTPDRAEDEDEARPEVEERDEKEERKRVERLTRDFGLTPDREDEDEDRSEAEERDEKGEAERVERLSGGFGIGVDLEEAVRALLDSMPEEQQWQHATITITANRADATFDHPDRPRHRPAG